MGLDITHGTWHGAYSAFHRWRTEIAKCLGIPLTLMEGFYQDKGSFDPFCLSKSMLKPYNLALQEINDAFEHFPLLWDAFKPNPLHELLYHSDCDGIIEWEKCPAIADELEKLLPELEGKDLGGHIGNLAEKTRVFIAGLRLAHSKQENIEFR